MTITTEKEKTLDVENPLVRIENCVFTDVTLAYTLLMQSENLFSATPQKQLQFFSLAGIIENQLYNYPASDDYFKKAIKLAKSASAEIVATLYIDYAGTLINEREINAATQIIGKTHVLLEKSTDEKLVVRLMCREAYLYWLCADYTQAINLFFQAEKKMLLLPSDKAQAKDYYFQTLIYAGMGLVFEKLGDLKRSAEAYLRVIAICTTFGIKTRLAWHYLNVGNAFLALQNFTEAESFFQKVIQNSDDLSMKARAYATTNLGYCYFKKNNFNAARTYFEKAELFFLDNEKNSFDNLSRLAYWNGLVCRAENDFKQTEIYWSQALKYALAAQNFAQQVMLCREIADLLAEKHDFAEAFQYERLHVEFLKKYHEEANRNSLRELELKYELERQKQETEMLRIQTNQLQLKALRAQMNPHFIFNALNAVQSYVFEGDKMLAVRYISIFADLMRKSLEYSETEFISLKNEIAFLESYLLVNQKLRFNESFQYAITVADELEEDIIGVPTMIVQPYIENAIEHGIRLHKGGTILIHFTPDPASDDVIFCTINDDGIGINKSLALQSNNTSEQHHQSRGTGITERRLEILNRNRIEKFNVQIIDKSDEGTTGTRVEIKIPIVVLNVRA